MWSRYAQLELFWYNSIAFECDRATARMNNTFDQNKIKLRQHHQQQWITQTKNIKTQNVFPIDSKWEFESVYKQKNDMPKIG